MERLFAESRPALARGTSRPRNTKDRPVGGLHVPADRGRSFVWQQRSSLTTCPLVKSKTQVFDNGGAMSQVCCPFVAGFPARRGTRARIPARRGRNRRVSTASPIHISTLAASDPAPQAGGPTAAAGALWPLPPGRG